MRMKNVMRAKESTVPRGIGKERKSKSLPVVIGRGGSSPALIAQLGSTYFIAFPAQESEQLASFCEPSYRDLTSAC